MIRVHKTHNEALHCLCGIIARSVFVVGYFMDGRIVEFASDKWVVHAWRCT